MPSEKKPRTIYLDLLRVLAMLGVVGIHVSAKFFVSVPMDSVAWRAMNLWDGLVRWSVPMFAMVSGALFLDPKRNVTIRSILCKSLPRIVLAYVVWSGLYAALHCGGDPGEFVRRLVVGHYHLWFLYMLAGSYLIVPALRCITASKSAMWYFLAVSVALTFVGPDLLLLAQAADRAWALGLGDMLTVVKANALFFFTLGFVPYFVLGYALHERALSRAETLALCLLGLVGFVLSPLLNAQYSYTLGAPQVEFFNYNKLCVLFQTAGVFAAAKALAPKLGARLQRLVVRVAACSFGVYLAHPLLLDAFFPQEWLVNYVWTYVMIPAAILAAAVGAFVIAALVRCIPWLGKRIA